MIITKTVKIELDKDEKETLIKKVEQFVDGGLCDGMHCAGIVCSPDCPIYNLDQQAVELRKSVLDFINGAE